MQNNINNHDDYIYDVALSFAGEDRIYAESLANKLREKEIRVFYDRFESHNLWGKNLVEYLYDVYAKKSRYCVILISNAYVTKAWPKHERQSAQERALTAGTEYILPIRIDNISLPGLPNTIGYIRLSDYTIDQIVDLILSKLGKKRNKDEHDVTSFKNVQPPHNLIETNYNMKSDSRYIRHQAFSKKLFEQEKQHGYFGLHSLTQSPIHVAESRLDATFLNSSRVYFESLTYGLRHETHPDGYTRRYQITKEQNKKVTTMATTCYYDGHIVTEGYLDFFLENNMGFNPFWAIYKIQRHLQLTKEIWEDYVENFMFTVTLGGIENFGWELFDGGHKVTKLEPYAGYHKDIIVIVELSDIYGRDNWNKLMPLSQDIMVKIARIFGMNQLPEPYWDSKGNLSYAMGIPGR